MIKMPVDLASCTICQAKVLDRYISAFDNLENINWLEENIGRYERFFIRK